MPNPDLPAIAVLFPEADPASERVRLSWRLVRRKGSPFLLTPADSRRPSAALVLYSAHRVLGKLWSAGVALVLETPLAGSLAPVVIEADAASGFVKFLAEQSGSPVSSSQSPAIKFASDAAKKMQLVLLLCDQAARPIRIIKVGLDAACRASIEREADVLASFPTHGIGCAALTGRFSSNSISAFASEFLPGHSLDTDQGLESLFNAWLSDGPPAPIHTLATWRELDAAATAANLPQWPLLRDALASQPVRTTISHGDFAPWNVRIGEDGAIRAFDWERGHMQGIPAWDWFHFIVQPAILVQRHAPQQVAATVEAFLLSSRFKQYGANAGIAQIAEPLLLAYLLHQKLVIQPSDGAAETDTLFNLLWGKWRAK